MIKVFHIKILLAILRFIKDNRKVGIIQSHRLLQPYTPFLLINLHQYRCLEVRYSGSMGILKIDYLAGSINFTSPIQLKNFKDLVGIDLAIDIWNYLEKINTY